MFLTPAIASFMDGQGLYDLSAGSNPSSSEVTRAPEPEVAPQAEPQITTASASAPAPAAKPAETEKRDYTVNSAGSKAHGEKLVNLRSCGKLTFISGDKVDGNRSKCDTLLTAESFVSTLMTQMPFCIQEAVIAKGITKPIKKSNIYNGGSIRTEPAYGDLSLHYKARAIDVWQIDVIFEDGSSLKTPMKIQSKNDVFYKKFNACWERLTKAKMKKINTQCQRYDGALDCNYNKAHHTHVHLSLPYCPKKTGYRGT